MDGGFFFLSQRERIEVRENAGSLSCPASTN
jgi:hypothetical protein